MEEKDVDLMKIWYFSLEMYLGKQAIKDKTWLGMQVFAWGNQGGYLK